LVTNPEMRVKNTQETFALLNPKKPQIIEEETVLDAPKKAEEPQKPKPPQTPKKTQITGEETICDVPQKKEEPLKPKPPQSGAAKTQVAITALNLQMVAVQGGTFTMGGTSEQGSDAHSDEKPTHQVTLSNYYIGKYPVTQRQWIAIMGSNPSYFKGDNLPVEGVSYGDIQEFIRKLNAITGKRYRLPTESEWEYAARGGSHSRHYKYSGSNNVNDVAWYRDNSNKTLPVRRKQANELGIFDMSGNVWEWCSDWFEPYTSTPKTNPTGPSTGSYRVNRGGSWYSLATYVRVSSRITNMPDNRDDYIGFRLACSAE
jgi:formylglycine-generating enzyme required for sulfatase activity